jgi:hypothetical protein
VRLAKDDGSEVRSDDDSDVRLTNVPKVQKILNEDSEVRIRDEKVDMNDKVRLNKTVDLNEKVSLNLNDEVSLILNENGRILDDEVSLIPEEHDDGGQEGQIEEKARREAALWKEACRQAGERHGEIRRNAKTGIEMQKQASSDSEDVLSETDVDWAEYNVMRRELEEEDNLERKEETDENNLERKEETDENNLERKEGTDGDHLERKEETEEIGHNLAQKEENASGRVLNIPTIFSEWQAHMQTRLDRLKEFYGNE